MPDYVTPLARAGGATGAAGGGVFGGLLGTVGDALSAPRRWLWDALGLPEEGSQLAADVFGLDKEGGLAQALGFGAEVLGDPLTYAGGLLGKLGGAAAGRKAGRALEEAAAVRGPRYPGGWEKIAGSGLPEGSSKLPLLLEDLRQAPGLSRALQEVPPGSQYLGHGVEALALKTPAGDVLRLSPVADDVGRMARPDIPEVLQPTRAGLAGDVRVERSPFAAPAANPSGAVWFDQAIGDAQRLVDQDRGVLERSLARAASEPGDPRWGQVAEAVRARLPAQEAELGELLRRWPPGTARPDLGAIESGVRARGFDPVDVHGGNVGFHGGAWKVIDPGAIVPLEGGPQLPFLADWTRQKQPGRFTNWLLDRLGADEAIRRELGGF